MENLNQGIVYVDRERKIRLCNKKAKEITGIAFGAHDSHAAGWIADGDVVILADNMLGEDDGNLDAEELRTLNIRTEIKKDEMLVAVGVYRNEKIDPVFKHVREHNLGVPLTVDVNYYGFSIKSSIDTSKKITEITVNEKTYALPYYRAIHRLGNPQAPFVEVNCTAIAPSLFESELFGYVGGAFTGAKSEGKIGFFEAADKGTIFLDEIGEMAPEIQVKLLHVLQNKTIYRVGSSKPVKIDVRVIAATNKNVEEEVAQGRIRQDLYYRLNVFPIHVPPIREHKADLYLLINQLLRGICEDYGLEPKQFSGEAIQKMLSYDWPGNVRELENVIERAISICDSDIVYAEHLCIGSDRAPVTMRQILAQEEKRVMEMTLMKYNGDKQKAMEELDISKSVFYDKLKKYGIK